ncbi:MAG: ferrous iron transporter B, partial [Clostridia bacterium]|nr:ferrous iron transporter B [Clostridia bacterium]
MKKVFLVGNSNTGKTTLLNTLTKANEHTGNWHGVSVEEKEKVFEFQGEKICLVDLPGIYSLNPLSFEEKVSVDYIFKKDYDFILNICDKNFLKKNLYLTIDLLLAGKTNMVIVVNTMGEAVSKEEDFSFLGLKTLFVDFSKKQDAKQILQEVNTLNFNVQNKDFFEEIFTKKTNNFLCEASNKTGLIKYEILKYFEKNNYFLNKINQNKLNFEYLNKINNITSEILIKEKYNFIDNNLKNCHQKNTFQKTKTLDKIFLNKFLAVPLFFLIMLAVFYLTFFSIGAFLSDALSFFVQGVIGQNLVLWLKSFCEVPWIIGLVEDGIIGGALSLVSFLPQVVMLFLCLAVME